MHFCFFECKINLVSLFFGKDKGLGPDVDMFDYTGIKCPVCGEVFTENDDVVVCPECGAPYHRHCYNEKGECIFNELHEKGETWFPPVEEKVSSDTSAEIKDKECHHCGILNAHSAIFCSQCGSRLEAERTVDPGNPYSNTVNNAGNNPPPNFTGFYGGMPMGMGFDMMGGVNPAENMAPDVTFGEASKLVQQNTPYFMRVFKKISVIDKSKFNFSAFVFSGGWLLYRKMYKPGIIVSLLMFVLYVAYQFVTGFVSYPIMEKYMSQIGMSLDQVTLTNEQAMRLAELIAQDPNDTILMMLPMIFWIAMLVVMFITGLVANRMYYNHCVKTVRANREKAKDNQEYEMLMSEKGGVNTGLAVVCLICYILCVNLPTMLLY